MNSSLVFILGLSFQMWTASNVSSFRLVLDWSIISQDISTLVPWFLHCLRYYTVLQVSPFFGVFNSSGQMSKRLTNIGGFTSTTSNLVHTTKKSSILESWFLAFWCLKKLVPWVPHNICKYQTFLASILHHNHGWCAWIINTPLM